MPKSRSSSSVAPLLSLALTLAAAILLPAPLAFGQTVQDVVNQVSQTWYRSYLGYPGDLTDANNPLAADLRNPLCTHTGDDRNNGQPDWYTARANLVTLLNGFGLTTAVENTSDGVYNVVARLPGTTRPQDIYIVGGHYDSANEVACPGADDNASGVAAVLEAARVLSEFRFEATIIFIAFDQEEDWRLRGSTAYARDANGRNDNILGMVAADMIAHNYSGENLMRVASKTGTSAIQDDLGAALQTYGGLTTIVKNSASNSDHVPFEENGFPACLLIEDYSGVRNTNYHKTTDSVDTSGYLDYAFATNNTRGLVGWLAEEAVVVPEPATFSLLALGGLVLARRRRRA